MLLRRHIIGAALSLPIIAKAQSANGTIVFPFAAGSGGDATSRLIAEKLQATLNMPFITDNKTGGNGRVGIMAVKNAAPDGKTFLVTTGPTMSIYPHFYPKLGFDVINDFTPISRLADFEFAVAVPKTSTIFNLADLKKHLSDNLAKANNAIPSLGTFPHFFGLLLAEKMGLKIEPIPFRGSAPVVQNIVGEQVMMGITPLSDFLAQHQAGALRVIAVFSNQRSPFAPEVATAKEQGYDIVGTGWYGLWAPAGLSKPEQTRLNGVIVSALKEPETQERLKKLGLIAHTSTPEGLNALQLADLKQWAPIIDASGFKPSD